MAVWKVPMARLCRNAVTTAAESRMEAGQRCTPSASGSDAGSSLTTLSLLPTVQQTAEVPSVNQSRSLLFHCDSGTDPLTRCRENLQKQLFAIGEGFRVGGVDGAGRVHKLRHASPRHTTADADRPIDLARLGSARELDFIRLPTVMNDDAGRARVRLASRRRHPRRLPRGRERRGECGKGRARRRSGTASRPADGSAPSLPGSS
eukprot:SAG31_NODE_131_length_23419_cov_38.760087_2_plen_205_part_00